MSRPRLALAVASAAVAVAALSACGTPATAGPAPAAPAAPPAVAPVVPSTPVPTTISRPPATTTVAPPPPATSRPANGAVVVRPSPRGRGTLEVRNGNSQDAYVTLARGDRADVGVYVRAGQTTRVNGVPDGSFAVYFTSGSGWAATQRRFTAGEVAQKFEQRLEYTTSSTSSTIWKLTLNPVPGGTARTDPVDTAAVPR